MFERSIFTERHDVLQDDIRSFLRREIAPLHDGWVAARETPRCFWRKAGAAGLLCRTVPERYGGAGGDFLESVVITEELGHHRISGLLTCLQSDIVAPFILRLGNDAQKAALLPGMCCGDTLGAIALTEPQGGSAIAAIETRATDKGASLILNGTKTHISNGSVADVIIVAARSDKGAIGNQPGLSLILVETGRPGVHRRRIEKAGMPALDTGEIVFENCIVPRDNLLGAQGMGFMYLMTFLGIERLVLAIYAQACCERLLHDLIADCDAKRAPEGSLLEFQNTRFCLADLHADCAVNRAYLDACIIAAGNGNSDPKRACIAKLRTTETLRKIAALGVQFRGASGISGASGAQAMQDLLDASVQSVWGGASEILRDVIGRSLTSGL